MTNRYVCSDASSIGERFTCSDPGGTAPEFLDGVGFLDGGPPTVYLGVTGLERYACPSGSTATVRYACGG